MGGIAYGDLEIAADVYDLPHTAVRIERSNEASYCIGHVVEVTGRAYRAEFDLPLARCDLRDDSGDHCPGRLARAVGIERPQDHDRCAEGAVERHRKLISRDLSR